MIGKARSRGALFLCEVDERERVFSILRQVLFARREVVFAYVYGSFLEDGPFHDIDVGVYLFAAGDRGSTRKAAELAMELERALVEARVTSAHVSQRIDAETRRLPVDVRVLNGAPLSFCYHVLKGCMLCSRNEELRVRWVEGIVSRYLDLKPLRHWALKEAMSSWD